VLWIATTLPLFNVLRVSENRVLRRIFGPKRDEVSGRWRRLHNEELHNLHDLLNIIRVIELRRMRWVGRIARTEEIRDAYNILIGKPEGKNHLEDPGIDGKIILEWILGILGGRA
jgi:hypothetical protein